MKYLSFDIECADGGKATICSFGYVLADENFEVIEQRDILMNPEGKFDLEGRAGRPDVKLAYPRARFERAPKFPHFYAHIKKLLEAEDVLVVGHSVGDDVTYLNKACKRYRLPAFTFSYFDVQRFYCKVMDEHRRLSLENEVKGLEIGEDVTYHRSDEDALATLLVLKELVHRSGVDLEHLITEDKNFTGRTENFKSEWDIPMPKATSKRRKDAAGWRLLDEGEENLILRGSKNWLLFFRYLDEHYPTPESNLLEGKDVCISMNYEVEHYKEMLHLIDLIRRNGGDYVLKGSKADIFATFDEMQEDGSIRRCSRGDYVKEAIENGAKIEITTLDELLALLGTTREELESAPALDVDYLLDERYGKKAV
jgi:DNA polymerase III epsilon subunit-like protein